MFFDNILGEEEIKDYSQEYLSFRPMKKLTKFKYEVLGTVTTNGNVNGYLQYSRDGGCTWKDLQPDTYTEDIRFNDVVMWRKNENVTIKPSPGDIVSKIYYWQEGGSHDPYKIVSTFSVYGINTYNDKSTSGGSIRFISDAIFEAYGNPASVLFGTNFSEYGDEQYDENISEESKSLPDYAFARMFMDNTFLYKADRLYLNYTYLSNYCCAYMFSGCSQLIFMPSLESTNLAKACYAFMFAKCAQTDKTYYLPPELPADKLEERCYYAMFYNCNRIKKAPLIKGSIAAKECCMRMFVDSGWFSKSIIEVKFDTLAKGCCAYMFAWSSLVPHLYSKKLAEKCYYGLNVMCYWQYQQSSTKLIVLAETTEDGVTLEDATKLWFAHSNTNELSRMNSTALSFVKSPNANLTTNPGNNYITWTRHNIGNANDMAGKIGPKWVVSDYQETV